MVKGIYSEKVMAHFKKPHNYGKIKDADGIGKVGNLQCGDVMWLYIKVGQNRKKEDVIKDIKFETFGCVAAIATSSAITDLAKGKTLGEAAKISKTQIVDSLGELPPIKMHCSVLASDALVEAIYDYLSKNKKDIPEDLEAKHEHIAKEKEETERRYKDWTEMEEKMHKE
jgi:nitrogen fixation NifU-like protein